MPSFKIYSLNKVYDYEYERKKRRVVADFKVRSEATEENYTDT
jgi:hypothetical protein